MRHLLYKEVRAIVRSRAASPGLAASAVSGTGNNYLTKNELRRILEELDIGAIRQQVFGLYGLDLTGPGDSEQRILLKAYYTYMSDRHFEEQVRQAKQAHERFTTAII